MKGYLFFFLLGIGLHTSAQKIYLPIKVKHQWSFLEVTDKTSHLDTTKLYDNLGDINLPWFGHPDTQSGYYLVEQNGKLGLVTASFKPVISPSWQEIRPISNEYFLVADSGAYTIIDSNEKPLLDGEHYQAIKLTDDNSLSFFMLKKLGKWGVQKKGQKNWSIKPEYFELEFIDVGTEGLFKVKKNKTAGDKWQIINWKESNLPALTGSFERVEAAGHNHIATQEISRKTNWSIRDLTGKEILILDPETDIKPLNKHLFGYKEKGSNTYSVLVMQKKISPLVEKFHNLQNINEDLVLYRMGEKAGFIQSNGSLNEIETKETPEVLADEGDLLRIKCSVKGEKNKKWGLYSLKEHSIIQSCQYDSIAPFHGHFAYVLQDGKTGLINGSGKLIAPPRFEEIPGIKPGIDNIYCYWKDSVQVYPIDQNGNLDGESYAEKSTATVGPEVYYSISYEQSKEETNPVPPTSSFNPTSGKNENYWQELVQKNQQDTLWIEKDKSYWDFIVDNYQMMQQEQVEVVIREKSAPAKKRKKKKRKKEEESTPPVPKKTKLVMKWVNKGEPFKFLRKASTVDWTLAYHDNGGLVSNELTNEGRTRRSARKISIFLNESSTLLPDFEMIGIRLSDFKDGLAYAAFIDLDGKTGLINKDGKQATDAEGKPLRFTYVGKAAEDKIQVCHKSSAFSQVGLSTQQLFQEFNVDIVNSAGNYQSELKSDKQALWGYIGSNGKIIIPFEYELAAPFKENFAINKQNGKWGAINADNEAVIPFEYDAIFLEKGNWKVVKGGNKVGEIYFDDQGRRFDNEEHARLAVKGHRVFRVQNGDSPSKYGYAYSDGKIAIPYQFDMASDFFDGLATVRKGGKWFFINEAGKETISIDPEIIGILEVGSFNEGLCPIRKTTILNKKSTIKYGYLNAQGKLAIPPKFDRAEMFHDGLAIVDSLNFSDYKPGQGEPIPRDRGLIDKEGNLITNYEFKHISPFNKAGFAEVTHSKTDKQGIIGKDGKVLTNNYYSEVKSFKDGFAGLDGSYWKVFDYAGKEISLQVSNIAAVNYFADNDLFVKDKSNTWYHLVVSNNNTEIKQGDFQLLQAFENGYAFAKMDKRNMLYGRNQSWVQAGKGQNFKFWSNNLIGTKTRSAEFYANLGFQNVFARTFDSVNKFTANHALVNYKGKSGIINRNGLFVVPPKFNTISQEKEGHIKVQLSGQRYGLRSKEGKEIVPAKYDAIRYLNNGIIKVEYVDFVGYYRANGEPLWELKETWK